MIPCDRSHVSRSNIKDIFHGVLVPPIFAKAYVNLDTDFDEGADFDAVAAMDVYPDLNADVDFNADVGTDGDPDLDADVDFELIFLGVISVFLNFGFRIEKMRGKDCPTGRVNLYVSKVPFLKNSK